MSNKPFAAVLAVLFAAGCAVTNPRPPETVYSSDSYRASADRNISTYSRDQFGTEFIAFKLADNLKINKVPFGAPMIVTTFVDLNDFGKSSVFGRVMAERLIDALSTRGFRVLEVRRGQDLFIKKGVGELILTQEVAEMSAASIRARIVLAGTYVATEDSVIINARIIDTHIPQVVSTASVELPMTDDIEEMLLGISRF